MRTLCTFALSTVSRLRSQSNGRIAIVVALFLVRVLDRVAISASFEDIVTVG